MTLSIHDNAGTTVGQIECNICANPAELVPGLFGNLKTTAAFFINQIPGYLRVFPMAVVCHLETSPRRCGHGREALRALHSLLRRDNVSVAFLRIGTQRDNYWEGLEWRERFYKSEGWISLQSPPIPHLVLRWMYRPLSDIVPPSRNCDDVLKEVLADEFCSLYSTIKPDHHRAPPNAQPPSS